MKPKNRLTTYATFIDLRKAFDTVKRDTLLSSCEEKHFPATLLRATHGLLTDTSFNLNGKVIPTTMGTPQGAVTSPCLFNIYLDDLMTDINTDDT